MHQMIRTVPDPRYLSWFSLILPSLETEAPSMLDPFPICSIIPNPLSRCYIPGRSRTIQGANGRRSALRSRKKETFRELMLKRHGQAGLRIPLRLAL